MDSSSRVVMYVGNQLAPSYDRPNGRPDRVWHGPGDTVEGIPPIQAAALCRHSDEWEDVTRIATDTKSLVAKAAAVRAEAEDRVRKLKNPVDAPNNLRNVDSFTTEQLKAELARRNEIDEVAASGPKQKAQEPANSGKKGKPKSEPSLVKAIQSAVEVVSTKVAAGGEETMLDENGVPTLEAVNEVLGYQITEDEYKHALNEVQA